MSGFKIEKDIPIPALALKNYMDQYGSALGKPRKSAYPFRTMEINDSFNIGMPIEAVRAAWHKRCNGYSNKLNARFVILLGDDHQYHIWRLS